jgi:hypothetical protein
MAFRTDRKTAQDRILDQFDKVIKNDKRREKDDLKSQLENLKTTTVYQPKKQEEEQPVFIPSYALKYKIENKEKKK